MSSNKKRRELNRAIEEHEIAKLASSSNNAFNVAVWKAGAEKLQADNDQLRSEIAAQQLVIEKMREALQMLDRVSNISCGKVQEALALPSDTTALNEVRKAERERCAKVCEELRHPDGYSGENVDWCAGTDHCAAAIRAMKDE